MAKNCGARTCSVDICLVHTWLQIEIQRGMTVIFIVLPCVLVLPKELPDSSTTWNKELVIKICPSRRSGMIASFLLFFFPSSVNSHVAYDLIFTPLNFVHCT